ncbi:MAG: type II toxin-antitoxin system RelE/ParE family toxin [bacterium]|nr:type II toxin-antitoxin system RelE/ParE family toxin [bacterium]
MLSYKVFFLAGAQQDLKEIGVFLDKNFGISVKTRIIGKIKQRISVLSYFLRLAPLLNYSGLKGEWRKLSVRPYVVLYQLEQTRVLIYHIFHMAQDYL